MTRRQRPGALHLSPAGRVVTLLALAAAATAAVLGQPAPAALAVAMAAALAVDAATAPPTRLHAHGEAPETVPEGGLVDLDARVNMEGFLPRRLSLGQALQPPLRDGGSDASLESWSRRGRSLAWPLSMHVDAPGRHDLPPLHGTVHGWLGLWRRPVAAEADIPLRAEPRLHGVGDARRHGLVRSAGETGRGRERGDDEFVQLRPFQHGDRLRDVNWRATARWQAQRPDALPVVNEREEEPHQVVAVLVDARARTATDPPGANQHAVGLRLAASWCEALLRGGDRVRLGVVGDGVAWTERGGEPMREVLEALASSRPEGETPLARAVASVRDAAPGARRVLLVAPPSEDASQAVAAAQAAGYRATLVPVGDARGSEAAGGEAREAVGVAA